MTTWFVPRDAAARSVGADDVAQALTSQGHRVVRTGSRGMLWLEPLVECAPEPGGARVGWSNVTPEDVVERRLQEAPPIFSASWRRWTTWPSRTAGYSSALA
jgi:hypothetical protein